MALIENYLLCDNKDELQVHSQTTEVEKRDYHNRNKRIYMNE